MPAGIPTIKPIMIPAINDLASIVLNRSIVFSGTNLPIKRPYAQVVMVANHVTGKSTIEKPDEPTETRYWLRKRKGEARGPGLSLV